LQNYGTSRAAFHKEYGAAALKRRGLAAMARALAHRGDSAIRFYFKNFLAKNLSLPEAYELHA
jgi:hypothetical protein